MLSSNSDEIASYWSGQMQKGYLKCAILLSLIKSPLHGYELMRHITEFTSGIIAPTAGGIYPALRELEKIELVKGKWLYREKKKVYQITKRGKDVFKKAIEKHFELASSIRLWIFKELVNLQIIKDTEIPKITMPLINMILLNEKNSIDDKIQVLEIMKKDTQNINDLLKKMVQFIESRIFELKNCKIKNENLNVKEIDNL